MDNITKALWFNKHHSLQLQSICNWNDWRQKRWVARQSRLRREPLLLAALQLEWPPTHLFPFFFIRFCSSIYFNWTNTSHCTALLISSKGVIHLCLTYFPRTSYWKHFQLTRLYKFQVPASDDGLQLLCKHAEGFMSDRCRPRLCLLNIHISVLFFCFYSLIAPWGLPLRVVLAMQDFRTVSPSSNCVYLQSQAGDIVMGRMFY